MRLFGAVLIVSLSALGAATPAAALEELKNCDDIKDEPGKIACMQAHISHLEETLLSLGGEVVELRHELKETLAANAVYKLQYVGAGGCLGFAAPDQPPVVSTCDRPDSWKLVLGAQTPAAPGATPTPATPTSAPPPGATPPAGAATTPPGAAAAKPPKPAKAPKGAAATAGSKEGAGSTVAKTAPAPGK
jgi:hypothetical protein